MVWLNEDDHVYYVIVLAVSERVCGKLLTRFHLLTMIRPPTSSIGLLLLLIGYAAAGPEPELRPRAVRSSACQEHTNLHSRLDVVEKKVEETVEKLEVGLASLLDAIEAPKWRPLLDNTGKTAVDILEEPGQRGES
ncbi:placenta-specific protein 9 isoform X2 [Seriola dumerili]|nr:placenta-specific protein 9 isoform X2 [Seriola dumerili]